MPTILRTIRQRKKKARQSREKKRAAQEKITVNCAEEQVKEMPSIFHSQQILNAMS